MKKIKTYLIHFLGGYTEKEYLRIERKYQRLLDSKSDSSATRVANEYIYRALSCLDNYARNVLFGEDSSEWSRRMYNVIHNNVLRIIISYISVGSSQIYKVDTTLDEKDQFRKIIDQERKHKLESLDDFFILETD